MDDQNAVRLAHPSPTPVKTNDYRNNQSDHEKQQNLNRYTQKNWAQQLQRQAQQKLPQLPQLPQTGSGFWSGSQPSSQASETLPLPLSQHLIHPQSDLVQATQRLQLDPSQSHEHYHHQHQLQLQLQLQQSIVQLSPSPFLQHVKLPSGADTVASSPYPYPRPRTQSQYQYQYQYQSQVQAQSQSPSHREPLPHPHLQPRVDSNNNPPYHYPYPYSHSYSHSRSHSDSQPNFHSSLLSSPQPYLSSSQPPQLPPLAAPLSSIRLSPFGPPHSREGDNYFLSSSFSRTPTAPVPGSAPLDATFSSSSASVPRLPAPADDLIVSPVSETRSSTPVFRSLDSSSSNERTAYSPAAAGSSTRLVSPILRRQPTSDSLGGASLFDDKDFERSLGHLGSIRIADRPATAATAVTRPASVAVTSVVAHDADVAHVTTDVRSDDWFQFTAPGSTISTDINNNNKKNMTVTMEQQQHQPQGGQFAPAATPSTSTFVPLPPIRRTSTFDLLRKKGLLDDDSDTAPSPIEKDSPPVSPVAAAQQTSNGQLSAGQSAPRSSPHSSTQAKPEQNSRLNSNPTSNPASNSNSHLHGQGSSSSPSQQPPNGPIAAGLAGHPGTAQNSNFMQMHPHQAMMGRGGPVGAPQIAPGQMMINSQGQGRTIIFPGGREWTVQESHLTEPLNTSNRNRSGNSPQAYKVYDKETEGDVPRPPPQPSQTRSRTSSASAPPTAAMRYPELFPAASRQHPSQGPVPLPQHPLLRGQNHHVGHRESMDMKETGMRVEQASVSSIASEEVNESSGRRASTSLFSLGHRRNSSTPAANQQISADGPTEKKKNFFASVAGITHSQPKPKPAPGLAPSSTSEDADQVSLQNHGDTVPVKKRLSELRVMIKGVGNAKEGAKDDQPVKVETVYESRPSMQAPLRGNLPLPGPEGPRRQAEQFTSQSQPGPFGFQAQQNTFRSRPSMQGPPLQAGEQPMAMNPPSFSGIARAGTGASQATQTQPPAKSEEGGKKGTAAGFLGGLFNKRGNKAKEVKSPSPQPMPQLSQRPMQPPPMQTSHLPFRPGQVSLPGQQLGPHPMLAGQPPAQRPGQIQAPPTDPGQPAPFLQTAQLVTIRRPSEITVSTQTSPQPNNHRMPSPQPSQVSLRQYAGPSPLRQQPNQTGPQNDGSIAPSQTSPLSDNSGERLTTAAPPISRIAPNRKPVGSANSRTDGPYMTSAVPPAGARPERSTASPSPRPGEQQRAPSQLSQVHQSLQTASSEGEKDMHQPSLPSLVPSPVPSNNSSSHRAPGDHPAGDSPDLRGSEQGLGVFQNSPNLSSLTDASGPGSGPNALRWGPNGFRPMVPPLIPPSAEDRVNPAHAPNSPAPSTDQGKLSKFFGAYDGGKPAAQPQANKERSAASKFLGAFKRSSKNNDISQSQQRPQTSPQISQNPTRPGMPAPSPGRPTASPGTAGEQIQAGRGQPGQMPPNGMPMQGQARQGTTMPGMVQGGSGQMPPYMQRPGPPTKAVDEPQYDQVPIPGGYEAVHGYGPGTLLAPSPYNAGRPGLLPMQYAQHPAIMQAGYRLRPIDPRTLQTSQVGVPPGIPPGVLPAPRNVPQGWPNNTVTQQSGQLHPQERVQNAPTNRQNLGPSPPQNQFPPQQFVQRQPRQEPATTPQGAQPQQVSQPQPNPNWQGTSDKNQRSSSSFPVSHPPPPSNSLRQVSAQGVPASGSVTSSGTATPQSQHASVAIQTQSSTPTQAQANIIRDSPPASSPANLVIVSPTRASAQSQEVIRSSQAPIIPSPPGGLLRSPDATRLTSRMSVSRQPVKNANASANASLSPARFADRTMNVSPEPPGARHRNGPLHQVSDQDLSVNVDRANSHVRNRSEDIYDATPRLHNATFYSQNQGETQAHENTKYAGSDKNRPGAPTNGAFIAGATAAGAAARVVGAAAVTGDNMSFLDGPDDSEPDDGQTPGIGGAESKEEMNVTISPPQRSATIAVTIEPEEKIPVDQPVELAAVNDDDDGIPMMTATSYPGQEWNPYGAGEFGDWE